MSIKSIFGKLHLWLGLASGIVVFIVSITGCIFVFEKEIRDITQKEYRFVKPQNKEKITFAEVTAIIRQNYPDKKIEQVRIFAEPDKAIIVKLENSKGEKKKESKMAVSVDPYQGTLLGPWNFDNDFLHTVEDLHKTLLLGETGKWIIKFNIVIFLFMIISGLVLWFPRKKNQVKNAFKMKFDAKWQRLNYDFHNVFGFYFTLPLLLITLTGIWWAIKPSQKLVYAVLGDKMHDQKKPGSVVREGKVFLPEQAFETLSARYPGWNEVHVNFPKNKKDLVKINLRYPYDIVKKQNVFEYDQYSGQLLKSELYAEYSAADKVKHANRDLHTGTAFGLPGKILMFLASFFAATLPISGFLIWYQRHYKKKNVKAAVRETAAAAPVRRKPVFKPQMALKEF